MLAAAFLRITLTAGYRRRGNVASPGHGGLPRRETTMFPGTRWAVRQTYAMLLAASLTTPALAQSLASDWARAGVVRDADRKSTRLNSSHDQISYAVFCLKKKKKNSYNV